MKNKKVIHTSKIQTSSVLAKVAQYIDSSTWLLMAYALMIRVLYLKDGIFSFTFDQGKDSLAVLHMVTTFSPKLIGPWTSIPGLYFGPAWYYLLAPFMWLFQFQPISAVIPMVILILLQIVLVKRYFGFWPALIIATTPAWLAISRSAWNPFPMTFISIILLIVFARWYTTKKITLSTSFVAGLITSIGFHFSTAFAIYYLPITVLLILIKRFKVSVKSIFGYSLGIFLPFLPQFAFELKHNFGQVLAVLNYVNQMGEGSGLKLDKLIYVISATISETKLAIFPELWPSWFSSIVAVLIATLVIFQLWRSHKNKSDILNYWVLILLLFSVISTLGYWFLHFNFRYLLGLFPIVVIVVGQALSKFSPKIQTILIILFLISPALGLARYFLYEKPILINQPDFLPVQARTLDKVYELAADRPFKSYHYIPAIYDYAYQFLYLQRAYASGANLPVDFAYEPNVPDYYQGKSEIMAAISETKPSVLEKINQKPEIIFYIVEKPQVPDFLEAWWGRQKYSQITGEYKMTDTITIYTADP